LGIVRWKCVPCARECLPKKACLRPDRVFFLYFSSEVRISGHAKNASRAYSYDDFYGFIVAVSAKLETKFQVFKRQPVSDHLLHLKFP
jgi:hypothetical protein